MRGEKKLAHTFIVSFLQSLDRRLNTPMLGCDVSGPSIEKIWQIFPNLLQLLGRHLGQVLDPPEKLVESIPHIARLVVPLLIVSLREGMRLVGPKNPKIGLRRKGNCVNLFGLGVDPDETILIPEGHDGLIENSAGDAHKVVFGLPGQLSEFPPTEPPLKKLGECSGGGQLKSCTTA